MRRTRIATAVLLVGALVGCANPPKHGTVIDTWYRPAHYNDWVSFICAAYNKNGGCTVLVPIYHHDFVPARWQVEIRKDADDTSKSDATGWYDVDETGFHLCGAGAHWPECNQR